MFQLGVVLLPSSSEALCHLGNGQLSQYEACEKEQWLKDAELSFRASLAMEGEASSPTFIPESLKEQEWWKKRSSTTVQEAKTAANAATKSASFPAPSKITATGKQPPAAVKQPAAAGRGKPGAGRAPLRGSTGSVPKPGVGGARKTGSVGGGGAKVPANKRPSAGGVSTGGKTVATLGDLKAGRGSVAGKPSSNTPANKTANPPATSSPQDTKEDTKTAPTGDKGNGPVNKPSFLPRLGLARTLAKTKNTEKEQESHKLYQAVINMAPDFHDAYIELGEALSKTNPEGAVEVYSKFPFSNPPTFDDAYLHGEIIRLLMKTESYDNPQLATSMIAMGIALGIGVLDKQVATLEKKFKYKILKKVYAGVHQKPADHPDLVAFFKFKCWN